MSRTIRVRNTEQFERAVRACIPGDTIKVKPGSYGPIHGTDTGIRWGTTLKPVIIEGESPTNLPVIAGSKVVSSYTESSSSSSTSEYNQTVGTWGSWGSYKNKTENSWNPDGSGHLPPYVVSHGIWITDFAAIHRDKSNWDSWFDSFWTKWSGWWLNADNLWAPFWDAPAMIAEYNTWYPQAEGSFNWNQYDVAFRGVAVGDTARGYSDWVSFWKTTWKEWLYQNIQWSTYSWGLGGPPPITSPISWDAWMRWWTVYAAQMVAYWKGKIGDSNWTDGHPGCLTGKNVAFYLRGARNVYLRHIRVVGGSDADYGLVIHGTQSTAGRGAGGLLLEDFHIKGLTKDGGTAFYSAGAGQMLVKKCSFDAPPNGVGVDLQSISGATFTASEFAFGSYGLVARAGCLGVVCGTCDFNRQTVAALLLGGASTRSDFLPFSVVGALPAYEVMATSILNCKFQVLPLIVKLQGCQYSTLKNGTYINAPSNFRKNTPPTWAIDYGGQPDAKIENGWVVLENKAF